MTTVVSPLLCYNLLLYRTLPQQPLLLRTRSIKPVTPEGHHHHTDYTIYYYAEGSKANPHYIFDSVATCYAGERHKFLQVNVTDVDSSGNEIASRFHEEFYKGLGLK